jgi:hypothetical protein
MLYGYAAAWKEESLRLARSKDLDAARIAASKHGFMAEYELKMVTLRGAEKPFRVVCTNREMTELPEISSEGRVERFNPQDAENRTQLEQATSRSIAEAQEKAVSKFFKLPGERESAAGPPIESTREDITGEPEEGVHNAALPTTLTDE